MIYPRYVAAAYVVPASMLPAYWIDATTDTVYFDDPQESLPLRRIDTDGLLSLETTVEYNDGRALFTSTLTGALLSTAALEEARYKSTPQAVFIEYTDGSRSLIGLRYGPFPTLAVTELRGRTGGEAAGKTLTVQWSGAFPVLKVGF